MGKKITRGCSDGNVWVWKPQEAKPNTSVQLLAERPHPVTGVAFAPNSRNSRVQASLAQLKSGTSKADTVYIRW